MQFEIGQRVFAKSNIRSWFDYSIKYYIPQQTEGCVTQKDEYHPGRYYVFFGKEFGEILVPGEYLSLEKI